MDPEAGSGSEHSPAAAAVPGSGDGVHVVVTGAASALGRRVTAALAADPAVATVTALDRRAVPGGDRPCDLRTDDVKERIDGASCVIHLASAFGPALDGDPEIADQADVDMARRVLDAAGDAGVRQVIVLSSATVYGGWPTNPVPLTENSPLRPDPGLAFAVQKAQIERLASEFRDGHPGTAVAVLRPALPVAADHQGWLAKALLAAAKLRTPDDDPPVQFLHLDDLASAVGVAFTQALDGAFNVAPDGWITPTDFAELAGASSRLRAPHWLADRVARVRWRTRLAPAPPGAQAYARRSWVVANDRLRATGWEPANSNPEAYVAGVPAGPWATVSPRRRQELALGATGVLAAGLVVGAALLVRRARRRSR